MPQPDTAPRLEVGSQAPEVRHELTRTDLVRYAGASGDFNPMHHDEVQATEAGMPSVFGHGMLSMGILGRALTDWVGVGAMRDFQVRFTRQTWPGDTVTTLIEVEEIDEVDGERRARLRCALRNQDGDDVVAGSAQVAVA